MAKDRIEFATAFGQLTGHAPFPWQASLYERFSEGDDFPTACDLPTGLGKTAVIAIWLIALANHPNKMPRRLVYVVNRRTVVDQTTDEVQQLRKNLPHLGTWFQELAVSTLSGQFADNRAWSNDPSKPAVICGTVDIIGSRLLFSGRSLCFAGLAVAVGDHLSVRRGFRRALVTTNSLVKGN